MTMKVIVDRRGDYSQFYIVVDDEIKAGPFATEAQAKSAWAYRSK
ncbi:MAG TPA: hypothetical protein VHK86_05695 [Nitrososphaera sp.]|jgi:hypothetical protein|nr:hypothetical protein [Nitrososphaera sp.]